MRLLAFGDSHTAGSELISKTPTPDKVIEQKKLAFPATVADSLGVNYQNFAMSGGSNDRSLRLLIENLPIAPGTVVLFCYTDSTRAEVRSETGYHPVGACWSHANDPVNDIWLKWFGYPDYQKTIQTMFLVDTICKQFTVNYRHIFLDQCYDQTAFTTTAFSLLDKTKVLKFPDTDTNHGFGDYMTWADNRGFQRASENGHFVIDAHQALASLICQSLNLN